MKQKMIWSLCSSNEKNGQRTELISAKVPGCVQLDMAAAYNMPTYFEGNNEELFYPFEDKYWHYSTQVKIEKKSNKVPYLYFESIEYECEIYVNGRLTVAHEGMFTPIVIDMSDYIGQTVEIEVTVFPAPKATMSPRGRGLGDEAANSCKPAFSYQWDWCPRFVSLGIVGNAYIEYRHATHIKSWEASYELTNNFDSAEINVEYTTSVNCMAKCELVFEGVCVAESLSNNGTITLTLKNPKLWWPHNHGDQPVYTVKLSLVRSGTVFDSVERRIGFRCVKLVSNIGAWAKPSTPIKTCSPLAAAPEINGRRIFIKGSNWVPPEMCISQLKTENVRSLLELVKGANMNAIRIWGGGYSYPNWFYDMCDELGILVWQEFPLACASYSDCEEYLEVLKQESESVIKKLRVHPCLMLWCGGNELFNEWSKMTPQSYALRLLDMQTYLFDRKTPFIFTSPQYGMAHGSYDLLNDGVELLTQFCESDYTAYTEFGCGAPSELEYLKGFMTEEQLANPFKDIIWEKRHAKNSSDQEQRWFDVEAIKAITGCGDSLSELCEWGNEAQASMYAALFEEVRRQQPYASMAMNWCFNEPWPTAAGNGLVNYPNKPRRSYYTVKEALKPTKLSIEFNKISWNAGEMAELTPWLLNDSKTEISSLNIKIFAVADGNENLISVQTLSNTCAFTNTYGNRISFIMPKVNSRKLKLRIICEENNEFNAEYTLFVK